MYGWLVPDDYMWGEALNVDEATGRRWQAALELLEAGGYIFWRGIGLTLRAHTGHGRSRVGPKVFVRVFSLWQPENMTPSRAEAALRRAQAELKDLEAESSDFAKLIAGRPMSFELLHDYGMGSVLLASWTDEGFKYEWKA
jgi:hypothetical protein